METKKMGRRKKSQVPEKQKVGLLPLSNPEDLKAIKIIKSRMGLPTIASAIRFAIRRVSDELQSGDLITFLPIKKEGVKK